MRPDLPQLSAAGMTCLMRANVGEIVRTQDGRRFFARLLDSNAEVARREGHAPSDLFMAEYHSLFADEASSYSASMLRDIERGGPVEGDHILGFMLAKARLRGVDDTLQALAFTHVQAYEQRRRSGRLP
jgi:2-dehydropantoate 2-reductase